MAFVADPDGQRYPLALFKDEDTCMLVTNEDQEASARSDGWTDWADVHGKPSQPAKRRGRPRSIPDYDEGEDQ